MEWSVLYSKETKPTLDQIAEFVNSALWTDFNSKIQQYYRVEPVMDYSSCSMLSGWNIKYKKSGKALCTLYPMQNYFIALVVIGNKEIQEAELIMPTCSDYVQSLFCNTKVCMGQRWLMLEVRDQAVFDDVFELISLRRKPSIAK